MVKHKLSLIILIISASGISRSPTIIIAYLMKEYNLSFEKAYELLKTKHNKTNPNIGFLKQLSIYEEELTYGNLEAEEDKK